MFLYQSKMYFWKNVTLILWKTVNIFDSKINVLQKRDYTYAKNFIRHLLTNKIFSSGIAPDLITELAKSYRIIEGNEINQLSTKYIWLKDEVNELIANDKMFER